MPFTTYLEPVFEKRQYVRLLKILEKIMPMEDFNSIAFRGVSGSAFAFPLSLSLDKGLICVRKEQGHHRHKIEGHIYVGCYAIVDDFVDSGATIAKIKNDIAYFCLDRNTPAPKCKAVFLYNECVNDHKPAKIWEEFPDVTIYMVIQPWNGYGVLKYENHNIVPVTLEIGELGEPIA